MNHIPAGVDVVRIVNTYSFSRWPADKAYCAKCEGKRHKHGFTAELDDGTLALPGSRCGEKAMGSRILPLALLFVASADIGTARVLGPWVGTNSLYVINVLLILVGSYLVVLNWPASKRSREGAVVSDFRDQHFDEHLRDRAVPRKRGGQPASAPVAVP